MSDERLREALRRLPPTTPGAGFTATVLARLDAPRRRPRLARGWLAAPAVALLLLGLVQGGRTVRQLRRTAELRAETAALARELAALRAEAERPAPVLYLGGNEEVDLVLDLATLPLAAAVPGALSSGRSRPQR